MGKPSPAYHVDLVDPDGNSVEPGTVGEIVLRTDKRQALRHVRATIRTPS